MANERKVEGMGMEIEGMGMKGREAQKLHARESMMHESSWSWWTGSTGACPSRSRHCRRRVSLRWSAVRGALCSNEDRRRCRGSVAKAATGLATQPRAQVAGELTLGPVGLQSGGKEAKGQRRVAAGTRSLPVLTQSSTQPNSTVHSLRNCA